MDRMPTSLIYARRQRIWDGGNRTLIPVPLGDGARGGIVLRPTAAQIRCIFARDGNSRWKPDGCTCGSNRTSRGQAVADCKGSWCDPRDIEGARRSTARNVVRGTTVRDVALANELLCGGRPYRPSQVAVMLAKVDWLSAGSTQTAMRNAMEVIVSPTRWNASLARREADWARSMPALVEAFWYPTTQSRGPCCPLGWRRNCSRSCVERMASARRSFLHTYHLRDAQVPLVELRRDRWDRPFA